MTDAERDKTINFILEQQAQLTATVGRLSEKVDRTADSITALLAIAELHDREIKETDDRLNALVSVVEKFIEGRGGR